MIEVNQADNNAESEHVARNRNDVIPDYLEMKHEVSQDPVDDKADFDLGIKTYNRNTATDRDEF